YRINDQRQSLRHRVTADLQGIGNISEPRPLCRIPGRKEMLQGARERLQLRGGPGRKRDQHWRRPGIAQYCGGNILLDHDVSVGAASTEGADAGAPRFLMAVHDRLRPGGALFLDVEW